MFAEYIAKCFNGLFNTMIDEFAYNDEHALGINGAQRCSLGINGAHIDAQGNK